MESLRILVVDDDAVDRMAVQRALRVGPLEARTTMDEAASAEEALAFLAGNEVDCVLLDLRLPGTSGLELLARLRAGGCRAPVVMLTGQGDEDTAVEAMKAGAADYLTKGGLDPERLARSIVQAVRVREAERSAEAARARVEIAEEQYRFLAESIPQMVWVTSSRQEVEYVNRQWVAYTGLDLEASRSNGWEPVIHPDDRERLERRWAEARIGRVLFEVQVRMLRAKDETYRWHLSRAVPLQGNDGVLRWFGTSTDIEEQKRAETELLELKELAERERLRAEEANDAKDQFLAVLSHELRTPLNAILGWVAILRDGGASPEIAGRALATIDRNARTQSQLIEDLLDVSRIVTGKLTIEARAVDVREIASAAAETVLPLAEKKGVVVERSFGAGRLTVRGDPARLQQVVWNLLGNAVKFSHRRGRVALRVDRDGDTVIIAVEDEGTGISSDFLPHVFDRFRQADASFARAKGGLGLGLSICKHIVERHRGTVSVSSAGPGLGAAFTVRLPADDSGTALATTSDLEPDEDALRGVDVLVVDDDDDSREMLMAALERRGAVTRGARSVADARAQLVARLPDVVVSDVGMPHEDGFVLARELRQRPHAEGGSIPAIALTGYAGLEDQRRARSAGFDHHVAKPVDLSALPRVIARLLAAQKVARSGSS